MLSESYKKKLMSLSGIKPSVIEESARIDFLKNDFTERVGRKYDKFIKFFERGNWDANKEPDKFIKNVVSETIFKNGKTVSKNMWVKFMLKQFEKLIQSDPTENKQYLNWIVNIYLSGNLLDEDIYKIPDTLKLFSKNKDKLPVNQKNINSFTSLNDLYDVVSKFESSEDISSSERDKAIKLQGAEQVYDSPNWKIIIPKTEEAACLYGKSTRWCTASKDNNRFEYYNKQGPLFILINKNIKDDRDKMKKLQFHFESNQFMDTTDRRIDITDFFKSNPELITFFEKVGEIDGGFKIEHMLVSKEEGLQILKNNKERLSLINRKGYGFFEKFYIEIGAKEELVDLVLHDKEFIKDIFYEGDFKDIIFTYSKLGIQKEGVNTIKSMPWINSWIEGNKKNPAIIESFAINIYKLGEEGRKYFLELIKKDGILWNTLVDSVHVGQYLNIVSHRQALGDKGMDMVRKMLDNPDIVKYFKSKKISDNTLKLLRNFYFINLMENKESRIFLKNIIDI